MKLELAIDRIVLEGPNLSPAELRRLRRTLERELGRSLAGLDPAALPAQGLALGGLVAPPLPAAEANSGQALGRSLAHSIHAALAPQLGGGK